MRDPVIVQATPDRPNIFLEKKTKSGAHDVLTAYEEIYIPECEQLHRDPLNYPVTVMYPPLEQCNHAMTMCLDLFGGQSNVSHRNCVFEVLCSRQEQKTTDIVISELKKDNPHVRLVFCTSSVGMGFNSPCVTYVIHGCTPRNLSDYVQQIGHA